MLLDLVVLNVLEFRGGTGNATVYEIPQHILVLMRSPQWGSEYGEIATAPWRIRGRRFFTD
jgi:hypothetical protein